MQYDYIIVGGGSGGAASSSPIRRSIVPTCSCIFARRSSTTIAGGCIGAMAIRSPLASCGPSAAEFIAPPRVAAQASLDPSPSVSERV